MSEQVEQGPTAAFVRPFDNDDIQILYDLPAGDHMSWAFVAGVFAWKPAREGE